MTDGDDGSEDEGPFGHLSEKYRKGEPEDDGDLGLHTMSEVYMRLEGERTYLHGILPYPDFETLIIDWQL